MRSYVSGKGIEFKYGRITDQFLLLKVIKRLTACLSELKGLNEASLLAALSGVSNIKDEDLDFIMLKALEKATLNGNPLVVNNVLVNDGVLLPTLLILTAKILWESCDGFLSEVPASVSAMFTRLQQSEAAKTE